ncbi:unnamed protein product [Calicophoron daubneyi]|uniref:Heat shock protein 70 n=1 Tax=Calicophoron daubneyi TaxID=300641 RepID=A0AAV2T2Z6_CALDB
MTPSYVAFTPSGCLIGEAARDHAVIDPRNVIYDSKRLIGRRFSDPLVQTDLSIWPFEVVDKDDKPMIKVECAGDVHVFTAEQILSLLLSKLKEVSEAYLLKELDGVVITVPAYFDLDQREATRNAAVIGGLKVLRILNEPTAAAIAYGLSNVYDSCMVLVFDLGGGTCDVSVIRISNHHYEVKGISGDTHLGGQDFDQRLVEYFGKQFLAEYNLSMEDMDRTAISWLRSECEKLKKKLSQATEAELHLEKFLHDADLHSSLSREQFDTINQDLFQRAISVVHEALRNAHIDKTDIQEVILVGGSSRIPKIKSLLQDYFNGKKLNMSINPDEAVGIGAAICASDPRLVLDDVTPLSLGLELAGGKMQVIIPKNTRYPTEVTTDKLTTLSPGQMEADFSVFEGDSEMVKNNRFLHTFTVKGLKTRKYDVTPFSVLFRIDENGILTVSAKEVDNENVQTVRIDRSQNGLSLEDINHMRMINNRYLNLNADQRSRSEARNALETRVYELKRKTLELISNAKETGHSNFSTTLKKCDEIIQWLQSSSLAEVEEYQRRERELNTL